MDESNNKVTKLLSGLIDSSDIFNYKHFCGYDIINPEENIDIYSSFNKNKIPFLIKIYFVSGVNSEVWPRTQAIFNKESDLIEDLYKYIKSFVPFNIEMMVSHVNSCDGYEWLMKRKYTEEPLNDKIEERYDNFLSGNINEAVLSQVRQRKITESKNSNYTKQNKNHKCDLKGSIRRILKEETKGIDSFLDEISSKYNMSEDLKDFVKQFIEGSDCKRINFSNFKIPAMGLALESGVLINSMTLNGPLPFLLFVIFHEISHQYQFKKYGEDIMYNCYLGEIPETEAAEFMKQTEEVADDFAYRKIRQLQKLNLIGSYTPPQMYKNLPIQHITMMVNNYRNDMRTKNIYSPKKVSEYFYNMVKSEL